MLGQVVLETAEHVRSCWDVNMLRFVLYGASAKVHCFASIQINDDLLNRIVRNGKYLPRFGMANHYISRDFEEG